LIDEREKAQNFDPSQPQMAAGSVIRVKLAELRAQLEKGPAAPAAQPVSDAPAASSDVFVRYIDLTFDVRYAAQVKEACLHNMSVSSPERWLEKDPRTFGGLDKSSRLWPRLALAWERYSEEFCAASNDPALVRSVYEQSVRASMTEKDVSPVVQFLAGDVGKGWYGKQREADLDQMRRLVKIQESLSDAGYRRYLDEQAKIFADFRKETEGRGKN
jgi:hypothetical protein